ncbi:MAG: universal stress protein [Alphaproteobacteria bacterium]|nr:universal stress protein [Alphaproteobacteria bacterium]
MSYKTILLGLVAGDPGNGARINSSIGLAAAQGAHLTALYMIPPFSIPGFAEVPVPTYVAEQYYADEEAAAGPVIEAFEAALAAQGDVPGIIRKTNVLPRDTLRENAPFADLIVLGQPHEDYYDPATDSLVGNVSLSAGLPVLAVPREGDFGSFGKNVLVAWTPRRECTRAVRDALPFLQRAERVIVLRANASDDGADVEIGAYLARHGVKADIEKVKAKDISVADAIIKTASSEDCDLIVMGAYGHSRSREYVFGGVTRDILRHMTVPTLFAH